MQSAKTRTFATNCLFGGFFLSVSGWGMAQGWAIGVGAGMLIHALIAVPAISLCGMLLVRYFRHWPAGQTLFKDGGRERRSAGWYAVLAIAGFGVAMLIGSGSLFLLACAAFGLVIVPWTRIPVCREHFFVSAAMAGLGTITGLALLARTIPPLHYPLGGCFFLLVSTALAIFAMAAHGSRSGKMPATGY